MGVFLVVSGPLDVPRTLAGFPLWGEDPRNRLSTGAFHRALRVDGRCHGYTLTWAGTPDQVRLEISVPGSRSARVMDAAVAEVRRICGLDLDLPAFYRAAVADPVLASLAGGPDRPRPDPPARPLRL